MVQTILVVEDNPVLAELAKDSLILRGMTVHMATNAPDALAMIREGLVPDILFSDIVMPGAIDGYELAMTVRVQHPDMCILLTTGWVVPEYSPFEVLVKPYSVKELTDWIDANEKGEVC